MHFGATSLNAQSTMAASLDNHGRKNMSTNMKAVIINEYGDNRVVRLAEIALPEPQAGEVRIRIHAAGVNPVDWKIRDGAGQRMGMRLPIHLGSEISGTIDRLGDGAGRFRVGDAVYGIVAAGGFAGYAIARAADIALKPASLDFTEAGHAVCADGLQPDDWPSLADFVVVDIGIGEESLVEGVDFHRFMGSFER